MNLDQPRIVLIGAGSAQFGYGTLGDIFQSEALRARKAQIVLHDIDERALAQVAATGREYLANKRLPFTISATTSRKQALANADFCIISIEVGDRFKLWEQDWRVPQQFGIRQVYGENGGPGGLFHSLRIIPPILEICADIADLCPEAFVLNFSNPMSRICTTVNLKYPELNFTGLCHEIGSLRKHLPKLLDTPFENLELTAGGLNHFSVLLQARYRDTGKDAYPEILEKAPAYFERYVDRMPAEFRQKRRGAGAALETPNWHERGVFKTILEKFRLLPITTDSHFGEYLPWAYEAADHAGILDFYEAYKDDVLHAEAKIQMELSERPIPIIEGLLGEGEFEEAAVNIPNRGLIPDLPEFMVVEVPALVEQNGIRGRAIGDLLPAGFTALLQNQVGIHRMTAEAVLSGSREVVLQALLSDPINDRVAATERMLDHMLELQHEYLGYLE